MRWRPMAAAGGAALLLGLGLGLFSSFGDAARIKVVNGLANATSPWVIVAFAAGAIAGLPRRGAILGTIALLAAVAVYYGRFALAGSEFFSTVFGLWVVAAIAAGTVLGAAGGAWRSRQDRLRTLAVALLAATLLAEAAYLLIIIETWTGIGWDRTYTWTAAADLVLAVALLVALAPGRRAAAAAGALPLGAIMLLGLFALDLF